MIKLYNQDCMEALKLMKNNQFDLAICDPPYGINISSNIGRRKTNPKSKHKKVNWDSEPPNREYFEELRRVSKDQIIWVNGELIFSNDQLAQVLNSDKVLLTIERKGETFLGKVPRIPLDDLRLTQDELTEISDWKHDAGLLPKGSF